MFVVITSRSVKGICNPYADNPPRILLPGFLCKPGMITGRVIIRTVCATRLQDFIKISHMTRGHGTGKDNPRPQPLHTDKSTNRDPLQCEARLKNSLRVQWFYSTPHHSDYKIYNISTNKWYKLPLSTHRVSRFCQVPIHHIPIASWRRALVESCGDKIARLSKVTMHWTNYRAIFKCV